MQPRVARALAAASDSAPCGAQQYLVVLDDECAAFGAGYDTSHSNLMRFEDGRRLHADTELVAGLIRTRLGGPHGDAG